MFGFKKKQQKEQHIDNIQSFYLKSHEVESRLSNLTVIQNGN